MVSIFELFKIGVGPSSSHTVGPMVGAYRFGQTAWKSIQERQLNANQLTLEVELYGSLALTGLGHATDTAVLAGLSGCLPASSEPEQIADCIQAIRSSKSLRLANHLSIPFDEKKQLKWLRNASMPEHPNAMRFRLGMQSLEENSLILEEDFFSTGGGFVYNRDELATLKNESQNPPRDTSNSPFEFRSADELMSMCRSSRLSIDQLVDANERVHRTDEEIGQQLDALWSVMQRCIDRGCQASGFLPGPLKLARRAPKIFQQLTDSFPRRLDCPSQLQHLEDMRSTFSDPLQQLDWVSLFALAVNEENAAGGKVVTAPTNGAAGIIPAVLAYYIHFVPSANRSGIHRFLKTAGAIGLLYKRNASLSAAEMGCQGEVGVACSMAAAGLAACMGGTIDQIENAAEIGMEHNLGLTCDPVAGLVQVPCIERNTMGAAKAINAARLAVLYGDGRHFVSLDRVIETMRQTGVDMQSKYKETSLGGLAVNVVAC